MSSEVLSIESEEDGDRLILRFIGEIDETSDFSVVGDIKKKKVIIDLARIVSLNSLGIRNWVFWIRSIPDSIRVEFTNSPRVVVDQLNVLQGFKPMDAVVTSFELPYFCDACGFESALMLHRGKDYSEGTADVREQITFKSSIPCTKCGEDMEIDVLEKKYFHFLKYRS